MPVRSLSVTDPAPEAEASTIAEDLFYPDDLVYLMIDEESEIVPTNQDRTLLDAYLSGVSSTPIRAAALYIDADNQSSACAEALTSLLRHEIAVDRIDAFIAGNHSGRKIGNWLDVFQRLAPEIQTRSLKVPITPDAADVALIMELGANLEHHIRQETIVIVVSRDGLLIRAAEQAKGRGARVFLAYADGDVPTVRNPRLTTLLLPVINAPAAAKPEPGAELAQAPASANN